MSTEVVLVGGTIGKRQEAIMIRVLKYFVKFIKNYSSRIPHDQHQLDIRSVQVQCQPALVPKLELQLGYCHPRIAHAIRKCYTVGRLHRRRNDWKATRAQNPQHQGCTRTWTSDNFEANQDFGNRIAA